MVTDFTLGNAAHGLHKSIFGRIAIGINDHHLVLGKTKILAAHKIHLQINDDRGNDQRDGNGKL